MSNLKLKILQLTKHYLNKSLNFIIKYKTMLCTRL